MRIGIITGMRPEKLAAGYLSTLVSSRSSLCTVSQYLQGSFDAGYILPHPAFRSTPELGRRVINSYRANDLTRDKVSCSAVFIENGIPTPATLLRGDASALADFVTDHGVVLLKYPHGSGGRHIYVMHRTVDGVRAESVHGNYRVEFDTDVILVDEKSKQRALCGPFYGQEYVFARPKAVPNLEVFRTYVIGDEVSFGMVRYKRQADRLGDSIINMASGAAYRTYEPTAQEIEASLAVARLVGFDIGVVDFVRSAAGASLVIECDCDGRRSVVDRKFTATGSGAGQDYNAMILARLDEIALGKPYRT